MILLTIIYIYTSYLILVMIGKEGIVKERIGRKGNMGMHTN